MEAIFTQKQIETFHDYLISFLNNDEYRTTLLKNYESDIRKLSLLEVYLIEHEFECGKKGIFDTYMSLTEDNDAYDVYDKFMRDMYDSNLCVSIVGDYDSLSQSKKYLIGVIFQCEIMNSEQYEFYDPFNPILTDTEEETMQTFRNFLLGEIILSFVDRYPNKDEFKQKVRGQFSMESKNKIIELLKGRGDSIKKYIESIIDSITGFNPVFPYRIYFKWDEGRTNISYDEVFDKEIGPKLDK